MFLTASAVACDRGAEVFYVLLPTATFQLTIFTHEKDE